MWRHLFLLAAIWTVSSISAFSQYIRCGTNIHDFKTQLSEQALHRKTNSSGFQAGVDTLYIPVVVHVLYNTDEENISDVQVKSQIDVLNEDYAGTNGTASQIPGPWKNFLTDSKIRFVLAARTPGPVPSNTTGITRKKVNVPGFIYNDDKIKFSAQGGADAWPTEEYLNIWVCNLYNNVLGFAPFPGSNPLTDGVVINYKAFGRVGELASKYNYGRTATHEVGHWLNLIHIWGDTPDCDLDDQVGDTPLQADANYCCPAFPVYDDCQASGEGVMFMNYMDYTDDKYMQFFTPDQILRMDTAINNFRSSLFASDGDVPAVVPALDISIEHIELPLHETFSRCFNPVLHIKNNGSSVINGFTVSYGTYKGNRRRHQVSENILPGNTLRIVLREVSGREGLNIMEFELDIDDSNKVNNYASRSFISPENATDCYTGDPFIYPNPVTGSTFCARSGFTESQDVVIRIVNSMGQAVHEEKRTSNPGDVFVLPMKGVTKGVYLVQMIGRDDHSTATRFVYFPDGSGTASMCE